MGNFFSDYKEKKAAEDADYKKRNPDKLPTKVQVICKILVGVFLLYIVYEMIRDGIINKILTTDKMYEKILFPLAMVVFVAAGIFSIVRGIKAYTSGQFFDPSKDDYSEEGMEEMEAQKQEEERKEAEAIEANGGVKPGSMASFAKLTAASSVSEEEQEAAYEEAKEANEEEELEAAERKKQLQAAQKAEEHKPGDDAKVNQ